MQPRWQRYRGSLPSGSIFTLETEVFIVPWLTASESTPMMAAKSFQIVSPWLTRRTASSGGSSRARPKSHSRQPAIRAAVSRSLSHAPGYHGSVSGNGPSEQSLKATAHG